MKRLSKAFGWWLLNGTVHEVYEMAACVRERSHCARWRSLYRHGDTRLSAPWQARLSRLINTHVHTTGNGGDYMLHTW